MRLLLDEMYSPAIAGELRKRDHEASAVTERPELRRSSDSALFATAQQERRALVSENIDDYILLVTEYAQRNESHFGLILVKSSKYPRSDSRTIGRMVTALDDLLQAHPEEDPTSLILWL